MIKYKKKKPTFYGLGVMISMLISLNAYILLRLFKVANKSQLTVINIFVFIMFFLEIIFLVLIIGRLDFYFHWKWLLFISCMSLLLFYFGLDCLPYWEEKESEKVE